MNFNETYKKLGVIIDSLGNLEARIATKSQYKCLDNNANNYTLKCSCLPNFKVPATFTPKQIEEELKDVVYLDVVSSYGTECDKQTVEIAYQANLKNALTMCYFEKQTDENVFIIYEDGCSFYRDTFRYKDANYKILDVKNSFKFAYNKHFMKETAYRIEKEYNSFVKLPLPYVNKTDDSDCILTMSEKTQYVNDKKTYISKFSKSQAVHEDFTTFQEERVSTKNGIDIEYVETKKEAGQLQKTITRHAVKSKNEELSFEQFLTENEEKYLL